MKKIFSKKNLKSLKKKLTIKNIRITGRTEIRKIIKLAQLKIMKKRAA